MSTSVGSIYRTQTDLSFEQVKEALEAYSFFKVEEMLYYDKEKKAKVRSSS